MRLVSHTRHVGMVLLLPVVSIIRLLALVARVRNSLLVVVGGLLTELLHTRPTSGHIGTAAASRYFMLRHAGTIRRGRRRRWRVLALLVHGTVLL